MATPPPVEKTNLIQDFLTDNLAVFIVGIVIIIAILIVYKKLKGIPLIPDYVRLFNEANIKDEQLNKPTKFSPKWVYRGDNKIGKINTLDTKTVESNPKDIPTFQKEDNRIEFVEKVTTLTVKINHFWFIWYGKPILLKYKEGEAEIKGDKIIFSSDTGFTSIGYEYMTKTMFKEGISILDGHYAKRLFETNVNLFASRMAKISAETPEMAHEINLRKLEIDKIKAEKERKMGSMM